MAQFSVQPSSINFGNNVTASQPTSLPFIVTYNDPTGTLTGTWTSATLSNTDFTLTGLPTFPLDMHGFESITSRINIDKPAGTYTATLTIVTSLATISVPVSATVTAGALTVSPPALVFAPQIINTTSPPQTVTITNTGTTPVTLSIPTFSNPDYTFSPVPTFPTTLGAGQSITLSVIVTPTTAGAISATLTITTNLAQEFSSIAIPLSANGLLFIESNALKGQNYVFLQGFGPISETRLLNSGDENSELAQTLTFNNTLWDGPNTEKVMRRLHFYYEDKGLCTLTATAKVQRYEPDGTLFTDSQSSTVTIGTVAADETEYSAFFDFQLSGELVQLQIVREALAGPCSLFMFIPYLEDKGEKVENK